MKNWIRRVQRLLQRPSSIRRPYHRRLLLEWLEERCLLSGDSFLQTNLVSDIPGIARFTDPNLLNPWGIAYSPTSPFWIADNNAGVSTLYQGNGQPLSLVVHIPAPSSSPAGSVGAPTGIVFNGNGGFDVSANGKTGSSIFIWATEDGTIAGWNPGVDLTHAIIAVDNSTNPTAADGAVYKGLTIATDSAGQTLLYASNFRAGRVDVFDTKFNPVTNLPAGAFTDPHLPNGYAPFGIQELNGKIFVTYALQDAAKHDDVSGKGHGFVDMYNLDGSGETRVASRGQLDSPWGLAIAPASFGDLAGDLVIGNFGKGRINAYSLDEKGRGHFEEQLKDPNGKPIQIDGLWALKVGNDHAAGSSNTLFFTAGINGEMDGLFGSLQAVPEDKEGDDGEGGGGGGPMGGDRANLGRDAAGSLKPAVASAAASSASDHAPRLATFVSPADLQTFAPHHKSDAAPFVAHASESSSFDWNNDVLVKDLLAL